MLEADWKQAPLVQFVVIDPELTSQLSREYPLLAKADVIEFGDLGSRG